MENKNKTLLTSPQALKLQDELNRYFYKELILKLSKALMVKPLFVWEIKSSGIPEIIKQYEICWPFGEGTQNSGLLCLPKSLANLVIHYSMGGVDKRNFSAHHDELTHMDVKIVETFFLTLLDFAKKELGLAELVKFQAWVDNPQLLPFIPPGKNFVGFESEISFDEQSFPILFLSQDFKVQR